MLVSWKSSATRLRLEAYALYLAFQDPRVPWYARAFTALIVGYTFSPIDLIPDFIPVLGYLDDLVIVPLGIALAIKMVPREVLEEYRVKEAKRIQQDKPVSWFAAVVIILLWVAICILIIIWVLHKINRQTNPYFCRLCNCPLIHSFYSNFLSLGKKNKESPI